MKELSSIARDRRDPEHGVDKIFYSRWSPRSMTGEEIAEADLLKLFEAARWAPSSFNGQPWRFVYARKGSEHWDRLFGLLGDFNKKWCRDAAALAVIVSRDTFEYNGKPAPTHSFDTGAAWQNLALQGSMMGLVVHGMGGFDYEKAKNELDVPENHTVEAMFAVGRFAPKEDLSDDLQEDETPSSRKKVEEFIYEGKMS